MAQGAAVQADTFLGGALTFYDGNSILLLDVTLLSLLIEMVGGVVTRLVKRNMTLPVHYSRIFTISAPFAEVWISMFCRENVRWQRAIKPLEDLD